MMMMMVMVVLDEPPELSAAVAVHVSVSPGETMLGDKVKLAALPKTSPASFVHA